MLARYSIVAVTWVTALGLGFAQSNAVTLAERFSPGTTYAVDLRVDLSGEIAVPGKPRVELIGTSRLAYDERVLAPDEGGDRILRVYRDVTFTRTLGGETQRQEVRPAVRRMVVLRSPEGKKAPFSPDGPLTFGEIDAVRVDLYSPVLVAGLLPGRAVKPGDTWPVTDAAVLDLTGLEKIEKGKLTVEYVGPVTVGGGTQARLAINGTVEGVSEDGPTRQGIDATAYFDLAAKRLTYLSLKGTQDLLDGKGQSAGRLTGRFTMTRSATAAADLGDAAIAKLDAKPTAENTLLLYENPDLRLRFAHPRNWRVGAVQGRQVTLEDPKAGGGILITVEPADTTPTAEAYRKEVATFVTSQKGKVIAAGAPRRDGPFDRFRVDAELGGDTVRMEYAVSRDARDGGLTFAARMPAERAGTLIPDVERILKDLKRTKAER
jgi:hypothetical protein